MSALDDVPYGVLYQRLVAEQQMMKQNNILADIKEMLQGLMTCLEKMNEANNEFREMLNMEISPTKPLVR